MKNKIFLLFLIISLYIVLNLPYLTTFPPINNVGDESWRMNIAVELLKTGRPVASMFVDTPIGEEVQITTPWIYNGLLTTFFYLFGVSIWTGRFLSFIFGIFTVILTYRFGKEVGGMRAGMVASLLISTSLIFSWHSREMRQEMMLLFFVTLGIFLFYQAWNGGKRMLLFSSALISTLSVQVHPNGAIFSVTLLLLYIICFRKKLFTGSTVIFLSGLSCGFLIWYLFNYLPYSTSSFETVHQKYIPYLMKMDFQDFIKLNLLNVPWQFTPPYLKWFEAKYHSSALIFIVYLSLFLVFTALIVGSNRKEIMFLGSFVLISLFVSGFITGKWNWYHHSAFLSVTSIAVSIAIFDIADLFNRKGAGIFFSVIIIFTIAVLGVWEIMKNNIYMIQYDYDSFVERVYRSVPEGATVLGAPMYYPAFVNSRKRFIGYLFLEERCNDFKDEIEKNDVDYVILDVHLKVSTTLWCSDRYFREQVLDFLRTRPYVKIEANYPSRRRFMKSIYLFKIK